MNRTTAAARRAFTLAEVVVALAIFAIIGGALLQAVAGIQESLIDTRGDTTRADARRFVLRRALASTSSDTLAAGVSLALADGSTVSWSATIEPGNLPDLHCVTLALEWDEGEPEHIEMWAYRPEWSDADTRSALLEQFRSDFPQSRLSTF